MLRRCRPPSARAAPGLGGGVRPVERRLAAPRVVRKGVVLGTAAGRALGLGQQRGSSLAPVKHPGFAALGTASSTSWSPRRSDALALLVPAAWQPSRPSVGGIRPRDGVRPARATNFARALTGARGERPVRAGALLWLAATPQSPPWLPRPPWSMVAPPQPPWRSLVPVLLLPDHSKLDSTWPRAVEWSPAHMAPWGSRRDWLGATRGR